MSNIQSILGTDLISNAPSVLNGNFNALNVSKAETFGAVLTSPSLIGIPTAPTASVGTATAQIATTSYVSAVIKRSEMGTYITQNPLNGALTSAIYGATSSIASYLNFFRIPQDITVNQISLEFTQINVPGSLRYGLYSANGQTQVASTIFASVTGIGIKTANISSVFLAANNYYQAFTPLDGNLEIRSTSSANAPQLATSVLGKLRYFSSVVVVAGALPTTFNPSALPLFDNTTTIINTRFDN